MACTTSKQTINVLAAGRRLRDTIVAETGITMKITDKHGGSSGATFFDISLTGTPSQIASAKKMFDEAIDRMEQWAEKRRNTRVMNLRRETPVHKPKKECVTTIKRGNTFEGLEVEELPDAPIRVIDPIMVDPPATKLSKRDRQQKNKRFVPLILENTAPVLPSKPAMLWSDMIDEDSSEDENDDENDGFTVVTRS